MVAALGDIGLAIDLATELVTEGSQVLSTLRTAHQQGRTTLTGAEWAQVNDSAKAAHAALERALGIMELPPGSPFPRDPAGG